MVINSLHASTTRYNVFNKHYKKTHGHQDTSYKYNEVAPDAKYSLYALTQSYILKVKFAACVFMPAYVYLIICQTFYKLDFLHFC